MQLTDVIMKNRAIHVFKDKNYLFNEVVFLREEKLVVLNRTSL